MRKTTLQITKTKVRGVRYWCVTIPKTGGGRTRRFFKATPEGKREAETFVQVSKTQQANFGTAALDFPDRLRVEAVECAATLEPYGKTLREAVAFFRKHLDAAKTSVPLEKAISELIENRRGTGTSEKYRYDLNLHLGRLSRDFPQKTVSEISTADLDGWLAALPFEPITRNTFRRDVRTLFKFCVTRDYCTTSPATNTRAAKCVAEKIGILTPPQLGRLLESADEKILPFIAIGAFAGLRTAELMKLDWSQIDLESGLIEVSAEQSKTSRRRLVKILPALDAWIRPLARNTGPVACTNMRKLMDAAKATAGIEEWPSNALRHSYASHHIAHFNDAAALALEMGHTNTKMIFEHYRQLVKPKIAERYWNTRPANASNVVAMTA